jgi:hypothetical protein
LRVDTRPCVPSRMKSRMHWAMQALSAALVRTKCRRCRIEDMLLVPSRSHGQQQSS